MSSPSDLQVRQTPLSVSPHCFQYHLLYVVKSDRRGICNNTSCLQCSHTTACDHKKGLVARWTSVVADLLATVLVARRLHLLHEKPCDPNDCPEVHLKQSMTWKHAKLMLARKAKCWTRNTSVRCSIKLTYVFLFCSDKCTICILVSPKFEIKVASKLMSNLNYIIMINFLCSNICMMCVYQYL